MTEYNDLLDAVDQLTKPTRTKVVQDDNNVATVEMPPLLDGLQSAIRSSMGGNTAGGALAHERSILDDDALFKFIRIASQIIDWCRARKVATTGDAGHNLRAWYASNLGQAMSDEVEAYYTRTLNGWAGEIRSKLDPWREKDLPDACPVCEAKEWWRDGERFPRPLIVRYKPDGPDMVQNAKAMCRACTKVWGVRELAYELEQAQQTTPETA